MDLINVVQVEVIESAMHVGTAIASKVDAFMHADSPFSAQAITSDCCGCRNNPA
ncbi:hypothetical protein [Xanthomonas campestris]|uniref:hypothetical protein n=1 Tax=Xanthomonas campestris TaxID=339 RepID=UPI001E51F70F|nr:hypothetical protein [Xanthomonas campestris]MCC4604626.1 hypothetical protein [Xanthomonas campestris pv. parthenii]